MEKTQRFVILALCVTACTVTLDARIIAPVLAEISNQLGVHLSESGWLMTGYLLPYGLFQIVYGPLAAKYGKIKILIIATLIFSIGTMLGSYWLDLRIMVALRVLTGLSAAAVFPLAIAYIGDTVPSDKRQTVIGWLLTSSGLAASLSVGVGGFIAAWFSWRWIFPGLGIAGFLCCMMLIRIERYQLRVPPIPIRTSMASYFLALSSPRVFYFYALAAIEGALYFGSIGYWGDPLSRDFNLTAGKIGLILSATGVGVLTASRLLPVLIRKFREYQICSFGGLLMTGSFAVLAMFYQPSTFVLSCLMLGVGFGWFHSTLQMRATEIYPANRSVALSIFSFALFLGGGAGSYIISLLIEQIGFRRVLMAYAILMLILTKLIRNFVIQQATIPKAAAEAASFKQAA